MAYNWLYNTSNDNIYILILIIVMLGLIIINFKLWSRKIDRFNDVQTGVWINTKTGAIIDASSFYKQSIDNYLYMISPETIILPAHNPNFSLSYPQITLHINGITYTLTKDSTYQNNIIFSSNDIDYRTNPTYYAYVLPNFTGAPTTTQPQSSTQPQTSTSTQSQTQTSTQPQTSTSTRPQTTSNTPTTTKASSGAWISLTGNPVNVTQEIYDLSIVQGLNNYYNKINTGSILINDINYNYLSPSPFRYGNTNYNIIKDVIAFNTSQTSNPNNPNDPNFIYIYVDSTSNTQTSKPQTSNPQSTIPQSSNPQSSNPQTTKPQTTKPQTTKPQSSNTQTTTKPQTTLISTSSTQQQCITIPLCVQPTAQPQTTTYDNPLNPNFYISKEEEARRNAWSQLDGDEESLHNTNGSNTTYQNDILYNPNNGGLLNNGNNQQNLAVTYSTIGDYATLDSLGANLTDTIGGINSNLGYTVLSEQLGTFNNYSNTMPNAPNSNTYDNTANYNTGMNPYTVNGASSGASSGSGTSSSVGSGISGKYSHDNKPIFMQKDFEGVSNIFAPNIYISNPPLTEDGNPDISFQM